MNFAGSIHFPSTRRERIPLLLRPLGDFGVEALAALDQRREDAQFLTAGGRLHAREDFGGRLTDGGLVSFGIADLPELGVEQPDKLKNFGDGGHGTFSSAARDPLLNGDRGWNAGDRIDIRPLQLLDELPRVGVEAVEITALALGKEKIEGQCRFTGAAQAGHDGHLVKLDIDGKVLKIVMARTANLDRFGNFP